MTHGTTVVTVTRSGVYVTVQAAVGDRVTSEMSADMAEAERMLKSLGRPVILLRGRSNGMLTFEAQAPP